MVQLHVGEEMQPGTIEGGAEEAGGECPTHVRSSSSPSAHAQTLASVEAQLVNAAEAEPETHKIERVGL